jgi:type I restriction enzyme S subunit
MIQADLSNLPFLCKRDAYSRKLSYLKLESGMTLISCSGTIGRMSFVRPDMANMWSSQDVMKICPDREKIAPGYLYAFLSSKYGVPLVISGTYGAIIQHIEPDHIRNLPVPRLREIEVKADDLMSRSSEAFCKYQSLIDAARARVLKEIGLRDKTTQEWLEDTARLGWGELTLSSESLRAYNYDPRAALYTVHLLKNEYSILGSLCEQAHFKGHIVFKRIETDPEYGYRLVGQREAFQIKPEGRWISRKSVQGLGLVVPKGTVLIPSHGTLGEFELYCRAVFVTNKTAEYAFSGDFYRCIPIEGKIRGGYLYAFLSTRVAFRLLRSMSTGGKQQYQHPSLLARMPIPRLDQQLEDKIADMIDEAAEHFDLALTLEDEARLLVEQAIEACAKWQK